jgi:hypothetical protein
MEMMLYVICMSEWFKDSVRDVKMQGVDSCQLLAARKY